MAYLAYLTLNPLGRPAPYTAKVISLKAKEIRPPKALLLFACCWTLHLTSHAWQFSLWLQLFYASPWRERKREKDLSRCDHSDSPGCCICHPLTNWRRSRVQGNLRRNDVKLSKAPELWWCGQIKYFQSAYAGKSLEYLSLTVHLFMLKNQLRVHNLICLGNQQTADPITCNPHFSLSHFHSLPKLATYY